MKLKIKIKELSQGCMPEIIKNGDWIDLKSADNVYLSAPQAETLKKKYIEGKEINRRDVIFDSKIINLGIAVQLPAGCEAIIAPRSSTFGNHYTICRNSIGIIDNTYNGNNDEWRFPVIAFKDTLILRGEKICQFKIQLSQKATVWQKLRWLFSSGVKLIKTDQLNNNDRGGFGSTGIK